jgi:CRP/FNR family cyclic AMP-dependent transcriptional regulator
MISPETLRRYPLFVGLDEGMLKQIAMLSKEHTVKPGEWLFHEGDAADTLYLLLDGAVKLTIDMDEKGERVEDVSTLSAPTVAGWSALVEPNVYTLGGRAAQEARVATIDAVSLRDLLDSDPEAGYQLIQNLTRVIGERLVNLRVQFVSMTV